MASGHLKRIRYGTVTRTLPTKEDFRHRAAEIYKDYEGRRRLTHRPHLHC